MEKDIAISVKNVSKTFKIPHEKISSLRGAAVSVFSKKRGYEEFKALDDVSFEVKKGEFFGIIGRNGSGKSTLLKILAGIYQTDKGSVEIDGMISPFLELGIGFNPELSGRDNVYLNATVLGLTKKEIDKKFDSIVAFSEIGKFIDQKLKNYSSGMQVRLAFSVSIHANREILLMDEVLAVGDIKFQQKCLKTFVKYKNEGKTILLVSHDLNSIQEFCDKALLMKDGEVAFIGKPIDAIKIFENEMFDDSEENNYAKKVMGTKEIEIVNIQILNKEDLKEKKELTSGGSYIFRILLKKNKDLDNIAIGLGVHSGINNQYCFALNSFLDKVEIDDVLLKRGFVDVVIPELFLNSGNYYINAIIGKNETDFNNPVFFESMISNFTVRNMDKNEGLFNIHHYWN